MLVFLICAGMLLQCAACGSKSSSAPPESAAPAVAQDSAPEPTPIPEIDIPYVEAADSFAGGTGTEADPYQIETALADRVTDVR